MRKELPLGPLSEQDKQQMKQLYGITDAVLASTNLYWEQHQSFIKQMKAATNYNSYPLGLIPRNLQRQEPYLIREKYPWSDAREIVGIFERKVAQFTGANYAVAVDCCTHALELAIRYEAMFDRVPNTIKLPAQTYVSVPMMLKQLGYDIELIDFVWTGQYCLLGTRVTDAAVRWMKGMRIKDTLQCLSFQIKKPIPIGRGGMILCDTEQEYNQLKLMSYDGRDLNTPYDSDEHVKCNGYHYYMTPEDAARGIILMDSITFEGDSANQSNYPDVRKWMEKI